MFYCSVHLKFYPKKSFGKKVRHTFKKVGKTTAEITTFAIVKSILFFTAGPKHALTPVALLAAGETISFVHKHRKNTKK